MDGSSLGYWVSLADNTVTQVSDPAFYGADRVECLDGYFVLNRHGTSQFYLSDNIARTFNPLWIAAKASLDMLTTFAVCRRELWLFGQRRTDIYDDAGSADFPLQIVSGGIDHGAISPHSIARTDGAIFWLSRDQDGQAIALKGAQYASKRISTHALEAKWQAYPPTHIERTVAYSYQQRGHTFIVFWFPLETWVYDLATEEWHQWQAINGGPNVGYCHAFAYDNHLVGDAFNGNLYALDPGVFQDNGQPIKRTRAFPHLVKDNHRVSYSAFQVDIQCGTVPAGEPVPTVTVRWSDDRGATWGTPLAATMGRCRRHLHQSDFPACWAWLAIGCSKCRGMRRL